MEFNLDSLLEIAFPVAGDSNLVMVPEPAVKRLLADVGVPVPRGAVSSDASGIATAASELTSPLVLKAWAAGLVHKSDAGAVELGIGSAADAAATAGRMAARLREQGIAAAGFLVEEQQAAGIEMIVGVVRRPSFGPVLAVGFGGTLTEILQDVVLRPLPLAAGDAEAMLGELKARTLLDGARGKPPIDRGALVRLILHVADLALALGPRLAEFEINPVIASAAGAVAVDGRLLLDRNPMAAEAPPRRKTDFEPLFTPAAIAVVGASAKSSNFGNMFLKNYRAYRYPGRLYAIHPEAAEIDGVKAYSSFAALPEPVDYALVAAPAPATPGIVRSAAGRAKFVQVMSGGFREAGGEGESLEADLVRAARDADLRLLGPNCMGVWSARGRQTFLGTPPERAGDVAIVSQSGSLGGDMLKVGSCLGIGFSCLTTVGNSIDVTAGELLEWLVEDPYTRTIGLYIEDPGDGARLVRALAAARAKGKPVILLVSGTSRQGADAAASHTGAMAGDLRIWRGIARQTGAYLALSLETFLDILLLAQLQGSRAAKGGDVLIVGAGGGCNVLATDACDAAGLTVAPVDADLDARLSAEYGAGASFGNPVEVPMGPRNAAAIAPGLLRSLNAARPYANILFHVNVQSFYSYGNSEAQSTEALYDTARALTALAPELPRSRLIWVLRNSICGDADVVTKLRQTAHEGGVATYLSFESAAGAAAALSGVGA